MQVKGTMLVDYVRMIRANKDKDWSKYLEPEDWEIINSNVFTTNKYPYESFRRIGYAVFKVIADSKLDTARIFGRFTMKNLLEIYKDSILVKNDTITSIKRLAMLRKNFMGGDADTKVIESGPDWARYQVIGPSQETNEEMLAAYCYQIAGHLEEIVEQAGGKNPTTSITKNDQGYEINLKWRQT